MKCILKERENKLLDYLEGVMEEAEQQSFEKHLFECDECFNDLQVAGKTTEVIREDAKEIFGQYFRGEERFVLQKARKSSNFPAAFYRWGAVAAAAVIVVALLFIFNNRTDNNPSGKNAIAELFKKDNKADQAKTTTPPPPKPGELENGKKEEKKTNEPAANLLAENFAVSPNFENLLNQQLRSGYNTRAVSPLNDEVMKDKTLVFHWTTAYQGQVTVEIYTNKEKMIFSGTTREQQIKTDIQPAKGLYYWKLESEDNLLFIGKFRVQ